ncbi:MAG TPA: hypothetical protein VGH14_04755 [Solirubrobacterales bacterium]
MSSEVAGEENRAYMLGEDQLAEIAVPTLFVWIDKNPSTPAAVAERAAKIIPRARFELIMTGRRRGSDDPRPLLALVACVAGYALLRLVHRLDPGRLSHLISGPAALPIALGATVIASALARQRHLATRRTLASRRAFVVVPADEFDATPELVGSFAAQLARSGRRIGGWWDRRASALRVRLTNDDDGRLVYLLEAPERDLRRCVPLYAVIAASSSGTPASCCRPPRCHRPRPRPSCGPSWSSHSRLSSRWLGSPSTPTRSRPSSPRWRATRPAGESTPRSVSTFFPSAASASSGAGGGCGVRRPAAARRSSATAVWASSIRVAEIRASRPSAAT